MYIRSVLEMSFVNGNVYDTHAVVNDIEYLDVGSTSNWAQCTCEIMQDASDIL